MMLCVLFFFPLRLRVLHLQRGGTRYFCTSERVGVWENLAIHAIRSCTRCKPREIFLFFFFSKRTVF